jgi:hypothetical protein
MIDLLNWLVQSCDLGVELVVKGGVGSGSAGHLPARAVSEACIRSPSRRGGSLRTEADQAHQRATSRWPGTLGRIRRHVRPRGRPLGKLRTRHRGNRRECRLHRGIDLAAAQFARRRVQPMSLQKHAKSSSFLRGLALRASTSARSVGLCVPSSSMDTAAPNAVGWGAPLSAATISQTTGSAYEQLAGRCWIARANHPAPLER